MLTYFALLGTFLSVTQATPIRIDWNKNRLSITGSALPGRKIEVWYLEAFCRRGSTNRKWEETTIPHETVRLDKSGETNHIRLRTTLEGKVTLDHDIRVVKDGLEFRVTASNRGDKQSEADWAQPCVQLAAFTGKTQETYIERSFIFLRDGSKVAPKLLSELPRTEEAIYKGGQVYVPAGIDPLDVNPRPLSKIVPAIPLIGCYSQDDKMIFAMAWDSTQELFQGVITCLHADFRLRCLKAGETKRIRGRIYLVPNDGKSLLKAFYRDYPQFLKLAK